MVKKNCSNAACPFEPRSRTERILVPMIVGGLILLKPTLGALEAAAAPNLEVVRNYPFILFGDVTIPYSVIFFFFAWIGTIYLVYHEEADHVLALFLSSCGLPGLLVGLAVAFSI